MYISVGESRKTRRLMVHIYAHPIPYKYIHPYIPSAAPFGVSVRRPKERIAARLGVFSLNSDNIILPLGCGHKISPTLQAHDDCYLSFLAQTKRKFPLCIYCYIMRHAWRIRKNTHEITQTNTSTHRSILEFRNLKVVFVCELNHHERARRDIYSCSARFVC